MEKKYLRSLFHFIGVLTLQNRHLLLPILLLLIELLQTGNDFLYRLLELLDGLVLRLVDFDGHRQLLLQLQIPILKILDQTFTVLKHGDL